MKLPSLAGPYYAVWGLSPWTGRRVPLWVDPAGRLVSLCMPVSHAAPLVVAWRDPWGRTPAYELAHRLRECGYRNVRVECEDG